nr:MAG: nonstructural protein [Microvirus sp.]
MMQGLYSIFDRKAVSYGAPMFFANDEIAKRSCADTMRAGGDFAYVYYPDDFDVYRVGSFDTNEGVIVPQVPAVLVCRFADFVRS